MAEDARDSGNSCVKWVHGKSNVAHIDSDRNRGKCCDECVPFFHLLLLRCLSKNAHKSRALYFTYPVASFDSFLFTPLYAYLSRTLFFSQDRTASVQNRVISVLSFYFHFFSLFANAPLYAVLNKLLWSLLFSSGAVYLFLILDFNHNDIGPILSLCVLGRFRHSFTRKLY